MQSPTTTAAGAVATDETDRLISSDKVVGTAVYNRRGEHLGSVYNLPNEVAEVAEAAEAVPEVAEPAELAEAAEAAAVAAAFRGELAASFARLEHFPIALRREYASQPV